MLYSHLTSTPERIQAAQLPAECKRLEGDHFYIKQFPGASDFTNLHFRNFKNEGNNFTCDVAIGMKCEPPYQLLNFKASFHFKQFQDGTWAMRRFFNHFIQYTMSGDFREGVLPPILQGMNDDLKDFITEF